MEKLKMHTPNLADENYEKLAALFPNAVTESIDDEGNVVRAIDKDVLMQEINTKVVDDDQERYQFTWPDKRKAIMLANQPIAKTLRLNREKSVSRDGTPGGGIDSENIYIEGDNLDALKLLRETYLGKVKMIYIDPPYNTGNDFIYEDNFSQSVADYVNTSGQIDENGNKLIQNSENNGRYHTDWLNMLYPRLRLAKDLLSSDGVIFISIDDHEQENLKKICNEIFGANNFIGQFIWQRRTSPDMRKLVSTAHDYIITYVKDSSNINNAINKVRLTENDANNYSNPDNDPRGPWASSDFTAQGYRPNQMYEIITPSGVRYTPPEGRCWKNIESEFIKQRNEGRIWFGKDGKGIPRRKTYLSERNGKNVWTWWSNSEVGHSQEATQEVKTLFDGHIYFDYPKPIRLIKKIIQIGSSKNSIVMDFFSGSATTAHAMMQLNSEDKYNRKFILIQIPEEISEETEAYKAGYKNICEIGEERIRRAGKKIKEEIGANIDYGFRCLKIDSSNMKDVYYKPSDVEQDTIDLFADNIKDDRKPEDLLIQVMLDLGVLLSSKIEQTESAGKNVFSVADGYLIACFDQDVTEDVVTAIAKKHPFYAIFRDSSMANDSVAANFEQIFETYSPETVRKVL
nr:site-specific DNA-methyltransferase [Mitsuokella multacida]